MTNENLSKIGWEDSKMCSMCNKHTETLEQLMLQCPCFRGAREKVPVDIAEMVKEAGGTKTLQVVVHQILENSKGKVKGVREEMNHWCKQPYENTWLHGAEHRTES